jgi:hypothetical protein
MKLLSVQWTRLSQVIIYYFQSARLILQNNKHRVEICTRICAFKKKEYSSVITKCVCVCVCVFVRVGVDVENRRFLKLLTFISKSK